MHNTEELNRSLLQRIAFLEDELNAMRYRNKNLLSTILSNICHDIRTPMNAIVGFANLLVNEKMDSKERNEFIDQININSVELLEMIDNMIDASLLQCGDIRLFCKDCFPNQLLDELYETYKNASEIKMKKLSLVISKGEENNFCMKTDPKRLKQIFKNLIGNAIKFTDSGKIEFGYHKYSGHTVRFFVRDTGIGLGDINGEDLFRPFHSRLKTEKDYINKGAGLGLSVSKRLINLMGGEIWPESIPGEGSCFYFTLPAKNRSYSEKKLNQICSLTKRNIASFF